MRVIGLFFWLKCTASPGPKWGWLGFSRIRTLSVYRALLNYCPQVWRTFQARQGRMVEYVQGSAKKRAPGSVNVRRKSCILLPAAGRRTQFFTSYSQNLRPIFSPSPVEWWATAPQLSKRLRTFSTDKQESGKHGWRIICISTCILTVLLRNLSRLFIIIYIFVMALVNAIKYTFNMKIFHKSCAFFFLIHSWFNLW